MSCPPEEVLSEHIDGEDSAEARAALSAHVERCPRCERELRWLKAVKQGVSRLVMPAAPCELLDGIDELSQAPPSMFAARRAPSAWTWAALAALAIVLTVRSRLAAPEPRIPASLLFARHAGFSARMPFADASGMLLGELAFDVH